MKLYLKESNTHEQQKTVDAIITAMQNFVDEFSRSVKNINCRYSTEPSSTGNVLYIDYSALRPTYSKADAKLALSIFNKYANIITMYLDTLKMGYPDMDYSVGKTPMSSAKIGKCLYITDFPFEIPEEYVEK